MSPTPPRSIYAARLRDEFPGLAFGEAAAFAQRGRWREFFQGRVGPAFDGRVVLEIGCNDGSLLARVAAKFPHSAFVGLDWKCKAIYDGAARVAGLGLRNVALLRGRAQDVRNVFGDGEADEIWVFHPDPCDRDVELKNRLIAEPFLADAHAVLRHAGSTLTLKTDHPGYYQWALALFGLPQPEAFAAAREAAREPVSAASRGASPGAALTPRVRVRDLMHRDGLPPASDVVRRLFDPALRSDDYWQDAAALARTAGRAFAGEVTTFESRFLKKRMPIYYLEMRKR